MMTGRKYARQRDPVGATGDEQQHPKITEPGRAICVSGGAMLEKRGEPGDQEAAAHGAAVVRIECVR